MGDLAVVTVGNRVVAMSDPARELGVQAGLRARETQRRAPGVQVLAPDPAGEAREFEPVLRSLESVVARIEIDRPGRCGFLTRGPSRYFGGDRAMSDRVVAQVRPVLAGRTHVGVGTADSRFAALVAAARAEPDQAVVVPAGASAEFLAPLPVTTLAMVVGQAGAKGAKKSGSGRPVSGAGFVAQVDELVDTLGRLGLHTLGAFAGLGRADVVGRFGAIGAQLHRWAGGRDRHRARLESIPAEFDVAIELDPPIARVDQAAFVARTLAQEFVAALDAAGARCARIEIGAETEHGEEQVRLWRADEAFGVAAIADRLRWQLDGWLAGPAHLRPTGGLSRLVLRPDDLSVAAGRQLDLWGAETGRAERAARSIARVLGLAGPGAVKVAELGGGRNPAEAVIAIPAESVELVERVRAGDRELAGTGRADARSQVQAGVAGPRPAGPWPGALPPPAPTRVPDPPVPIELVGQSGQLVVVNGRGILTEPPAYVAGSSSRVQVLAWSGPWLLDERWWNRDRRRRAVRIQVALADGRAMLIVALAGQWSVEAIYD